MRHGRWFLTRPLAVVVAGLVLHAAACGGGRGAEPAGTAATAGDLVVSAVRAPAPAGDTMAVYFTVTNRGGEDDALVGVATEVAGAAMLHRSTVAGGTARMEMVAAVPVPAHGTAVLEPGGYHVMLAGLRREVREGETITVTLTFARAGTVTVAVPVVSYREVAGGDTGG